MRISYKKVSVLAVVLFLAITNYLKRELIAFVVIKVADADVLVVFGSKSDENIYAKIADELKQRGISYELRICSAHRTPEMLDDILKKTKAKVIIAGAGLAAHLPGVVASKTIRPVIGVPVNSNFDGLDSLLSIIQMPPGIPVLSVGIDNAFEAAESASYMLKGFKGAAIVGNRGNKRVKKCVEVLKNFGAEYAFSEAPSADKININFIDFGNTCPKFDKKFLVINVPLKESLTKGNAVHFAELAKNGLWLGINRAENAAIAAVEILNINGKFTKKLNAYREEMKKKVLNDDKSLKG